MRMTDLLEAVDRRRFLKLQQELISALPDSFSVSLNSERELHVKVVDKSNGREYRLYPPSPERNRSVGWNPPDGWVDIAVKNGSEYSSVPLNGLIDFMKGSNTEEAYRALIADDIWAKQRNAVDELKSQLLKHRKRLQVLSKEELYNEIDDLMQAVSKAHELTGQELHDLWVAKYNEAPDDWIMHQR